MSESRTTSTLELVNEQQLQDMSQIDLSRSDISINYAPKSNQSQVNNESPDSDPLGHLRSWPSRMRDDFRDKFDEAKAKSGSKFELFIQLANVFSGILIWAICFLCTVVIPIVLFIAGLVSLDDCSDRPALPYLVFATGFGMTMSNLFNLGLALDLPILRNHEILSSEVKSIVANVVNVIFNCIVAFLYTISAYMVYTIQPQQHLTRQQEQPQGSNLTISNTSTNETLDGKLASQDQRHEQDLGGPTIDCNYFMYYTTYWFITLTLSLIAVLTVVASVCFTYNRYRLAVIKGSTPRAPPAQTLHIQTNISSSNQNINTNPSIPGINGA